jgi:lipoprotein-anchoring transpeptidase ErfK/SrfK
MSSNPRNNPKPQISRRSFIKLTGLVTSSLALNPLRPFPDQDPTKLLGIGRVTVTEVGVHKSPSHKSDVTTTVYQDQLITLYDEVNSPDGPPHNPRWYRVTGGYAHTAYIQRVESTHLNSPLTAVAPKGQLGEVTMPYADTMIQQINPQTKKIEWKRVYRLYYQSVHWITGLDNGPDGKPWYRLTDELLRLDYHISAVTMQPILPNEISPISPNVPFEKKHIVVSLSDQTVTAYESGRVVLSTKVSTGLPGINAPGGPETQTPTGEYNIGVKMPSKHMGDGYLTDDLEAYELPGVPWVCFFAPGGIAFHGTFWHDNFGTRMSHGCVNMRIDDAKWLFRWTMPPTEPQVREQRGYGTSVQVIS